MDWARRTPLSTLKAETDPIVNGRMDAAEEDSARAEEEAEGVEEDNNGVEPEALNEDEEVD